MKMQIYSAHMVMPIKSDWNHRPNNGPRSISISRDSISVITAEMSMEASEPMMPDAWATTLWAISNTAMTRFQVLVTSKIAAADLNTCNRHHDGVGEVLNHTENAAVPPLRGLAHLRGDVCDLLVHAVEHPR